MLVDQRRCSSSVRSQNGTSNRTLPCAALLESCRSHARYLRLGPRLDRAFVERQRLVGNHQVHVVIDGVAEALAARAGAERTVEAEQARLGLAELRCRTSCTANFSLKRMAARQSAALLEDHFAGFAIADFDGIDQALVQVRARWRCDRPERTRGFAKSISSSDSGVENSNIVPS